jgi:hypothetical protein
LTFFSCTNLFDLNPLLVHGDHDGVGVGAAPPFIGGDSWYVGEGVRIKIFLKK